MELNASLLPHHETLIRASNITSDIAEQRGYRTVMTKRELRHLGFSDAQASTPALLLPVHSVTGEVTFYQIRPDQPRHRNGKALKYETPTGARMAVDVPPATRPMLGNPSVPLIVTEGIRKADAAVSVGLCAVDLIGVWNWRGRNEHGGKTILADFESIALNGRDVYIAYDSDVMTKPAVTQACRRLAMVMKQRGARVQYILLPAMPNGAKQGLDDFLAAGQTTDALFQLARSILPEHLDNVGDEDSPARAYRATERGMVWTKSTRDGPVETPLTNFTARILADIIEDDGVEHRLSFELEASLAGRVCRFMVPAAQFPTLSWATEHLGARAIVYPGIGTRDHARVAMQLLSEEIESRSVYAHTGWRDINGTRCYLHADGAIGPTGLIPSISVALPSGLTGYGLPEPPSAAALQVAIRASLRFLAVAPPRITYPILAAVYRAATAPNDMSMHLAGSTGEGKSELAALAQQHFGATMNARNLPGSWDSTANALEAMAFAANHALFVVDDFMPNARGSDAQRLHKDADRLLRASANGSGRQRMRADTTLRPPKPPRALILSTGEDIPRGQSLRARMLILELAPGEMNWTHLSQCQQDAADGVFAASMAGFVQWLAEQYPDAAGTSELVRANVVSLRHRAASSSVHRRTPEIVANLASGFRLFLDYATASGALAEDEAATHWTAAWDALGISARAQVLHHDAGEPAGRFVVLITSAVASGAAHVASRDGGQPEQPQSWGWRKVTIGSGEYQRDEWRPQGARIGWIDGGGLFLDPTAAYAAAQQLGRDTSDPLTITPDTLGKRLHERGYLAVTDHPNGELRIRRTFEGHRQRVWSVCVDTFYADQQSGQSGQRPRDDHQTSDEVRDGPDHWPDIQVGGEESWPDEPHGDVDTRAIDRIGRIPAPIDHTGVRRTHAGRDTSPIGPVGMQNPVTPATRRCLDCGTPCGSASRCSPCAAARVPRRAGSSTR